MGWLHLIHFLDIPSVRVRAVVDSQYSNKPSCRPPVSFVDLINSLLDMGVECVRSVSELSNVLYSSTNGQKPKLTSLLCVVAGRTEDNPRTFRECLHLGATHIYLEPPGAPSAIQLRDMATLASVRNVQVYMGYQKLCSAYVQQAVEFSRSVPKSHVFFCHNEGYTSNQLSQVISRQSEGIMLSMASQELAILVTQYKITVGEVDKFKVNTNRLFSEKVSFVNDNGKSITDLIRVAFKITTKRGKTVSVMADRCGGVVSFAVVKSPQGEELRRFQSMTEGQMIECERRLRKEKTMHPNFVVEKDEYVELKQRVVEDIQCNNSSIEKRDMSLLTILDGVDIMMLGEFCSLEIDNVLRLDE